MFLVNGNQRGYKKLLVGEDKTVGVDQWPSQPEFEMAKHCSSIQVKKTFCPLTARLLHERLYSIWSTCVAQKSFSTETVDLHGIVLILNSRPILHHQLCKIFENGKLHSTDKDPNFGSLVLMP